MVDQQSFSPIHSDPIGKGPSRFKGRCFSAAQGARLELSSERLRVPHLDRPAATDLSVFQGGELVGNNCAFPRDEIHHRHKNCRR